MLHIYYGREDLDKEKFLFDRISTTKEKTFLLVPDQFTLQAERNAFEYLGVKGIIDLEILSQSRLGFKVLSEVGADRRVPIDKYGRHMLLTKILAEENQVLLAFRGMHQKTSFVEMANNFISEMKQFNTSPDKLLSIISAEDENSILAKKLKDIYRIYNEYEKLIDDKYVDTEDYLNLVISKIESSDFVKNSIIWINGFDYFTPKTFQIVERLMETAREVNVVVTADNYNEKEKLEADSHESRDGDLFEITKGLVKKLELLGLQNGIEVKLKKIPQDYKIKEERGTEGKHPALIHMEREIYSQPYKKAESNGAINLCQAANFYGEAETAAVKILELTRDEGLRYRDILVICNDMETRGSVIKRVFAEYGISAFLDKKRDILHHPTIEFICALIDITSKGWLYEDVFRMLKTNLAPFSQEECEELENYAVKYKIKGKRWKTDFTYGLKEEGEDGISNLNEMRKRLCDYILEFENKIKGQEDVKGKILALYAFLSETAKLPEKIEEFIEYLVSENQFEYAEEAAQIWQVVVTIFEQMVELLADEKMKSEDFATILKSGFEAFEIGVLPPTIDQIIVGTMQRTRVGNIKALIVLGANDGLLPAAASTESLLNEDEKALLYEKGIEICKIDDLRIKEEKLAIYKTLSKPSKYIWVGYSAADLEGKESKPSILFDKIRRIYSDVQVSKDILNQNETMGLIETSKSTLKYMTEAFRNSFEGHDLAKEWQEVYKWYKKHKSEMITPLEDGLLFTNKQEKIKKDIIERLYKRDPGLELIISPSRLEKFSRCPFSHLINYGLRPDERRIFEIAGREIGDVYHYCLMKLSEKLSMPGVSITDEKSPWMQINIEQCQKQINDFVDEAAKEYKEGVLVLGEEEQYRAERMKKVCGEAAWALVCHVQSGKIQKLYFESEFGRALAKQFPPIEVKLEKESVFIEGKIDRVDILNSPDFKDGQYVKIIDYKSGREKFDAEEAKAGWKLQLMLYLKAAMETRESHENKKYKPAGVFYFEIGEPQIDITDLNETEYLEKVKSERKKTFKLDGVVIDEKSIIESIAGEFSGYSDILPVRKNKEGQFVGTTENKILAENEFSELLDAVNGKVNQLCKGLAEGTIEIKPKKVKDETACRFCMYKSICFFDTSFDGCEYEAITSER